MTETHENGAPAPEPPAHPEGLDAVGANLHRFEGLYVGLAALLAALAQVGSILESQWRLVAISAVLGVAFLAFYALSHRSSLLGMRRRREIRLAALAMLVGIPLISLPTFVAVTLLPRWLENGTTLAVTRFTGPALPTPYADCRPSEMLVASLREIADRYHHLKIFELPYAIEPNARWAGTIAQSHGLIESADVVVYGEYNLLANAKTPSAAADRVLVQPHVNAVPRIPLPFSSVPLPVWDFPARVTSIDDLCGGKSPGFLDDARRLALTVVGTQLLNGHDVLAAERALAEARFPHGAPSAQEDCNGNGRTDGTAACPGVLAFYLANLDHALGHEDAAVREYRYAARNLFTAAPYVDLGQLYAGRGRFDDALAALQRAVDAEPRSVVAVATLAMYERDRATPRDLDNAVADLDRALRLPLTSVYDEIALAHALHQRGDASECGLRRLEAAIGRRDFDRTSMVDTLVVHGRWLRDLHHPREAIAALQDALQIDPQHIKANYVLGLALADTGDALRSAVAMQRATHAHAYTDEEFLDQANAAHELGDERLAIALYGSAIAQNSSAVYAFYDRGVAELEQGRLPEAERDLRTALRLHPTESMLLGTLADVLAKRGRTGPARALRDRAGHAAAARHSRWDRYWSAAACAYVGLDVAAR